MIRQKIRWVDTASQYCAMEYGDAVEHASAFIKIVNAEQRRRGRRKYSKEDSIRGRDECIINFSVHGLLYKRIRIQRNESSKKCGQRSAHTMKDREIKGFRGLEPPVD